MIGVDVHHDRIEPAAEIVAMPLAFMGQRAFDRILQQVDAVFGRARQRACHADKLRQAALHFRFEQVFRRGGSRLPRRCAITPGGQPARDC